MQRPVDIKKLIKKTQDAINRMEYQEAEQYAKEVIAVANGSAQAHALLGFALAARNDASGLDSLNRAIELEPRNLVARLARADWYRKQKNKAQFKADIQCVIEDGPRANEYVFQRQMAEIAFILLGDEALDEKNYEEAYHYYQKAREINPNSPLAVLGMGRAIFYDRENPTSALGWFQDVMDFFSYDPRINQEFGMNLLSEGHVEKAAACFKEAVETTNQITPRILLALAKAAGGSAQEAFKFIQPFLKRQDLEETRVIMLAEIVLAAGEADAALALVEKFTSNIDAMLVKACIHYQKKDLAAFRETLQAIAKLDVNFTQEMLLVMLQGRLVVNEEQRATLRLQFDKLMAGRVNTNNPKLLAIASAAFACGDQVTAKAYLLPFLRNFYPLSVKQIYQKDFLKMVSMLPALSQEELRSLKEQDRFVIKNQLLIMIRMATSGKDRLAICLRALCRDSLLGSIFHLQRNNLPGQKPSILEGALESLAVSLNTEVRNQDIQGIDPETISLLKKEIRTSRSFAHNLEKKYPDLYTWIGKLSIDMFPPRQQRLGLIAGESKKEKIREERESLMHPL